MFLHYFATSLDDTEPQGGQQTRTRNVKTNMLTKPSTSLLLLSLRGTPCLVSHRSETQNSARMPFMPHTYPRQMVSRSPWRTGRQSLTYFVVFVGAGGYAWPPSARPACTSLLETGDTSSSLDFMQVIRDRSRNTTKKSKSPSSKVSAL